MDLLPLTAMLIRSLQPVVGRELAWRKLSPSGPSGMVRRRITGKLLGVGEIYIPYRLYRVKIEDRHLQSERLLAVDAVSGTLDPFEFPESPKSCLEIETRNHLPARLSEAATRAAVLTKARRLLFSAGFFRLARPAISAEVIEPEFHIPYWAGFYGAEKNVGVVMLDAVRGTVEGGKATHSVRTWLMETQTSIP
jgi:hypothetical protein